MQKAPTESQEKFSGISRVCHDEQYTRLESKLKRELGETVLDLLSHDRTEDIVLNPDSTLWVKQMGQGFQQVGVMPPA